MSEAGNVTNAPPTGINPNPQSIVAAVFVAILIVVTLFGNGLVCVSFYSFPNLRVICNYFIVSLSVADILVALLAMPFWFIVQLNNTEWPLSQQLKLFWSCIDIFCGTASIMNLTAVSVDRMLAIVTPFKYPKLLTPKRALVVILVIWLYSTAIASSRLAGWPGNSFLHFVSTVSFFLPLSIVIVMYTVIFIVVKIQVQRIGTAGGKDHANEMKAAKTILVVIGAFVICWLPFFAIVVGHANNPKFSYPMGVYNMFKWMEYLNSCLNPVIYTCMNRTYRRAFKRLFTRVYLEQTVGTSRRGSSVSMYLTRRGSAISGYINNRKLRGSLPHTVVTNLETIEDEGDYESH